jgi:hypothetical protein
MNNKYKIVISLFIFIIITGCSQKVATYVWNAPETVSDYPENKGDINKVMKKRDSWKAGSTDFGIAFSGGGTRSAAATLGQMQALFDLGWLEKADYISAISGGAWGSLPFMFLPEKYCDEETKETCDKVYLGHYTSPDKISEKQLMCSDKRSLSDAISEAKYDFLNNNHFYMWLAGRGDETFARYLGNIFLRPFKLKSRIDKDLGEQKFFAYGDEQYFNRIIDDQKKVEATADKTDFFKARVDRPFYIASSTLMTFGSGDPEYFLPVEMTPFYVGVPTKAKMIKREKNIDISNPNNQGNQYTIKETYLGGYVEPFAYDFLPPADGRSSRTQERVIVKSNYKKQRFSLFDVLAATGAAPHKTLRSAGPLEVLTQQLGFPEFIHWGVRGDFKQTEHHQLDNKKGEKVVVDYLEQAHGDGGHLDNIGIMPLLARKVKNILVFVNTQASFHSGDNVFETSIYDNITSFFNLDREGPFKKVFEGKPHNVIFNQGAYTRLLAGLNKQQSTGGPLIYCEKYDIRENKRYNISYDADYKPAICWVYLDRSKKWLEDIKNNVNINMEMVNGIDKHKGEFKHFPHYWTFFNNIPRITLIDMSHKQVNLLANLTAWTVRKGVDIIKKGFYTELANSLPIEVNSKNFNPAIKLESCDKDTLRHKELLIGE